MAADLSHQGYLSNTEREHIKAATIAAKSDEDRRKTLADHVEALLAEKTLEQKQAQEARAQKIAAKLAAAEAKLTAAKRTLQQIQVMANGAVDVSKSTPVAPVVTSPAKEEAPQSTAAIATLQTDKSAQSGRDVPRVPVSEAARRKAAFVAKEDNAPAADKTTEEAVTTTCQNVSETEIATATLQKNKPIHQTSHHRPRIAVNKAGGKKTSVVAKKTKAPAAEGTTKEAVQAAGQHTATATSQKNQPIQQTGGDRPSLLVGKPSGEGTTVTERQGSASATADSRAATVTNATAASPDPTGHVDASTLASSTLAARRKEAKTARRRERKKQAAAQVKVEQDKTKQEAEIVKTETPKRVAAAASNKSAREEPLEDDVLSTNSAPPTQTLAAILSSDVHAGEPSLRQQSVEAIEQLQQEIKFKFSIGSAEALREAQELREDIERREEQLKALTNRES
jgi:hypothetical protein